MTLKQELKQNTPGPKIARTYRIPKEIDARVKALAEDSGQSQNNVLVYLLRRALKEKK